MITKKRVAGVARLDTRVAGVARLDVHGHRGSRGTHPENTIVSFEEARDAGAAFIELDVHLSRDGYPVVFHDFSISGKLCRDREGREVAEAIPLSELTLQQIQSYDVGSARLPQFPEQKPVPGAGIPSLEEVLQWALARAPGLGLNIEIKRDAEGGAARVPAPERLAEAVIGLLSKYNLFNRALVQSFDHDVVRAARSLEENLRLSCLFEKDANFGEIARDCRAQVAAPHFPLLTERNVGECMNLGIEVLPWTVNEPGDWKRLIGLGVRSLITDYPRKLREFVE